MVWIVLGYPRAGCCLVDEGGVVIVGGLMFQKTDRRAWDKNIDLF